MLLKRSIPLNRLIGVPFDTGVTWLNMTESIIPFSKPVAIDPQNVKAPAQCAKTMTFFCNEILLIQYK